MKNRSFENRVATFIEAVNRVAHGRQAREELYRVRNLLDTLMENIPDRVYFKDTESRFIHISRAHARLFNLKDQGEAIGKTDFDFFTREHAQAAFEDERRIISTGEPVVDKEEKETWPDRPDTWVITTKMPTRDPQGNIVGIFGVSRDITDRKRAEEELLQEQVFTKTMLESLPGIFYLYSYPELRLVRWNNAHETLFGFSPEELNGRSILDWHPPENRGAVLNAIEIVMNEGQNILEAPLLTKDGRQIPFLMTGVKFEISDRKYLVGVGIDITDRKRAEKDKARLEDQLQQAQKMESVGRLAGGVAHDFNNMLGVILGHTEMALEQVDPSQPLHANLEEIRKAAERSADLTRQLLAFARKQTVAPSVLDLNKTVEGMLTMLTRLVGEDVRLAWRPMADLWPVKVDRSQVDQLLTNLCVNARDAISDVGKITIETCNSVIDEARCADHAGFVAGEYVLLTVTDDGRGMDEETQSHLFEPFFTTKETGKGTGLGLATVYGIVTQNDGFIDVHSEPGRGTRFTIYLPRHSGTPEQARRQEPEKTALRGRETILLVEDEPSNLTLFKEMLERQGYTVLAAGAPGEAVRLAREHAGEIHLLMTDVIMPEMNGRDLARTLLNLFPRLKRLFASGYTADVIAHHSVLDEGVHFIQKPFSIKELAAKVREALESG